MWKNIVVSGLVMTSLLLLPLMAAAGGHHGGGHGPRGYRNVDQWLQSLPEEQQVKARAILEEARPAIEDTRRQEPGLQQHDPAGRDPYVFPAGDPRTLPVTSAARMKHPGPAQAGLFLYPAPALGAGRQGCMKICLLYNF